MKPLYETGKPHAAVGTFPYPHKTVAEMDRKREDMAQRAAYARECRALARRVFGC